MSEVEIDSYEPGSVTIDRAITAQWPTGDGARSFGETFEVDLLYFLTRCKFKLRKSGLATGLLKAYLYLLDGPLISGLPTGDPIAESDGLDISTLTSSYVLKTFTFSGAPLVAPGSYYALVLYSTDGNMSPSIYVRVGSIISSDYEGDSIKYLSTFDVWQHHGSTDFVFYVYGILSLLPHYRRRD